MAEQRIDTKALRATPAADLATQVDALRRERWDHRLKLADGSIRQTHRLRFLRRQLARMLTIQRQQQAAAQAKGNTT
jgi:ribosomal protein L29